MLRDIEARHAKETESQRQQWVRQQEEARNRVQELKEEESSSDEEPEEDATDKRRMMRFAPPFWATGLCGKVKGIPRI